MKILVFHQSANCSGGGASQYVMDVLPRLRAAGHQVALVHAREAGCEFSGTGYIYDEVKSPRPLSPIAVDRLEAILEDFVPDLAQMHQLPNHHIDAALRGRLPVVRFVHDHRGYCSGENMTWRLPLQACREPHSRRCLVRHFSCRCGANNPALNLLRYRGVSRRLDVLRAATRLQTLSPQIAENLARNGIPAERIDLLPAPAPDPVPVPDAPSGGRRIVLHVGGLLNKKGVWIAIRTLREMPADCDLIFAGGGEDQPRLEEHIRRRGLAGRVRIFPHLTAAEWAKLYRRSTLVIMPYLWNEPLGLPGLRATAYGVPVAAIAAGGISGWIEEGVNGRLLPLRRRAEFPRMVGQLLRDPAKLREMGHNARRLWEVKHRAGAHLASLLASFAAALAK